MPIKLKWPWFGVAIPCFLISFISYGGHYFILNNVLSIKKQIWFQFSTSMIWISYYLAIYTDPGTPTPKFKPLQYQWKNFCMKCNNYKPERSHHCRTCKTCVLMMDHHCPWTMNCVGYNNFPEFMRFLFWIILTSSFLLYHLLQRIFFIWANRDLPSYMFQLSEIILLTVLAPLDAFMLLTIALLFIRCTFNQIISGKTQIESWEMERLESLFYSKRLLPQLIKNLWEIFPNTKSEENKSAAEKLLSKRVGYESIVSFPYDINIFQNCQNSLGSPLQWLWIFGGPSGDGMTFEKNELSIFEPGLEIEDLLVALPWPPDGGKHASINDRDSESTVDLLSKDGEQVVRKRSFNNVRLQSREEWYNDWGENLEDFGVDVDVE